MWEKFGQVSSIQEIVIMEEDREPLVMGVFLQNDLVGGHQHEIEFMRKRTSTPIFMPFYI